MNIFSDFVGGILLPTKDSRWNHIADFVTPPKSFTSVGCWLFILIMTAKCEDWKKDYSLISRNGWQKWKKRKMYKVSKFWAIVEDIDDKWFWPVWYHMFGKFLFAKYCSVIIKVNKELKTT